MNCWQVQRTNSCFSENVAVEQHTIKHERPVSATIENNKELHNGMLWLWFLPPWLLQLVICVKPKTLFSLCIGLSATQLPRFGSKRADQICRSQLPCGYRQYVVWVWFMFNMSLECYMWPFPRLFIENVLYLYMTHYPEEEEQSWKNFGSDCSW